MELDKIKDFIKSPINSMISEFNAEIKQIISNRILEYQSEEFNRNYYSKTILHRATPKKLYDFYQPLYLKEIKSNKKSRENKISTENIKDFFKKNRYITIIGDAGSGKSTLVKYFFVKCIEEGYKIPIKIELRYLNDYKGNLISFVKNEVFKFENLGSSDRIIERLLESGNFLFFLDGYDELNSQIKEGTTQDINRFVKRFNKNIYVLTSRPYTGIEMLPLFHNYHVCDLNDDEINQFINKQIPKEEMEVASKIISAIKAEENQSYKGFLRNPLLLSMFILTFQSYASIPQKRTIFYRQVFETLYSHHDSMSKLAYVREKKSGLSKEQFEEILKLFSFISFFEEVFIFTTRYFNDTLTKIKFRKNQLNFDNSFFIEDLQVAIGIINQEGLDYTFPHRSLQEYFAALFIASLNTNNKVSIYSKIKNDLLIDIQKFLKKENFFSILIELDFNDFTKHITIPYLHYLKEELLKINIDEPQVYSIYGKLNLVIENFLSETQKYEDYRSSYRCKNKGLGIHALNPLLSRPSRLLNIALLMGFV